MKTLINHLVSSRIIWPIILLIVLLVINAVYVPGFFSITIQDGHLYGSLIDILRNGAPKLIIAVGMTLVISTGGIDLSVGSVCAISGAIALSFLVGTEDPSAVSNVIVAVSIALGVAIILGAWNGFLVSVLGIQPIIATLVLMTAGRGIAMLISKGQISTVTSPPFKSLATGFILGFPLAAVIAVCVLLLAVLVTRRTSLGRFVESVGINPEAARQAGVQARSLKFGVYVFCAFCAGLAGLIIAGDTMAADSNNAGLFIELDAILAVVIGGTSLAGGRYSLGGTLVGALVIQTLVTTVYTIGVPPNTTMVFKAAVVAAVCFLQSPATARALARRRRIRAGRKDAVTLKEKDMVNA